MKEPEFFEQAGAFYVRLWSRGYRPSHYNASSTATTLTVRQEAILAVISQYHAASTSLIASALIDAPSQRTIQKDLLALKKTGIVISEGLGKKTVWLLASSS